MKRILSLAVVVLFAVAATPSQPPASIVALTQAVLDAVNTNNRAKLAGLYTRDAAVVDETAPFFWRGADAGVRWWDSVQRGLALHSATLHATGSSVAGYTTDREGGDAYLTQAMAIVVTTNGKATTERGTQTYTFHRGDDGNWNISRQVWTTTAPTPRVTTLGKYDAAYQMMDAFNARTPDALVGLYTSDATFIDDLSPLVWDGADAGAKWYATATRYLKANGIEAIHGALGALFESNQEGGAAYLIVPVRWSGTANGKPFVQRGTYTFTLRNVNRAWLITSQTWLAGD
jgi:ketosteroid isomerase-like protein